MLLSKISSVCRDGGPNAVDPRTDRDVPSGSDALCRGAVETVDPSATTPHSQSGTRRQRI